jgi:peptide/nickel transport system substrate-binding protein
MFVELVPDQRIRLERFPGYLARSESSDGASGRKQASYDSMMFVPVGEPAVRVAGVKRGEFHFAASIPNDEFARLQSDPEVTPRLNDMPFWLLGAFNHRAGMMTNKKIRQAFQAALDLEAVMRGVYGDRRFWRISASLVPDGHPLWTDAGKEYLNQRNPARARQLLAEGGYKGEPVRWLTTMEYADFGTAAQVAKPMLERAGFVVDLQLTDWATLISRRARPELWDVFVTSDALAPEPALLLSLQPTWPGWYDNRDMGAMLTLLRRYADPKARRNLWARMQRLWYEDAASIKFGDFYSMDVQRRELKGFTNKPVPIWWNSWLER